MIGVICIVGVIICTATSITRYSVGWMAFWMAASLGFMTLGIIAA